MQPRGRWPRRWARRPCSRKTCPDSSSTGSSSRCNEACFALQEGLASAEDIDTAMKLGTNVPMGPLALADFIGLNTCLSIAEVLHKGLGESKYRPAPLLRQYVDAGWLGRKTKRGFYRY